MDFYWSIDEPSNSWRERFSAASGMSSKREGGADGEYMGIPWNTNIDSWVITANIVKSLYRQVSFVVCQKIQLHARNWVTIIMIHHAWAEDHMCPPISWFAYPLMFVADYPWLTWPNVTIGFRIEIEPPKSVGLITTADEGFVCLDVLPGWSVLLKR